MYIFEIFSHWESKFTINKVTILLPDLVGGHALAVEAECLPELQSVHRDGQGDLLPWVGDVPTLAHDHRTEEPAHQPHGDKYFGRKGSTNFSSNDEVKEVVRWHHSYLY